MSATQNSGTSSNGDDPRRTANADLENRRAPLLTPEILGEALAEAAEYAERLRRVFPDERAADRETTEPA